MDDALIGGHIDAAVFFSGGEAKGVIVLVDRAADGAKAVMAVGHGVGNGEFDEARSARGLDDADVGDIVRSERVEADAHGAAAIARVVGAQNLVGNGVFSRGAEVAGKGKNLPVFQCDRLVMVLYHPASLRGSPKACHSFVILYHRAAISPRAKHGFFRGPAQDAGGLHAARRADNLCDFRLDRLPGANYNTTCVHKKSIWRRSSVG